MALALFGKKVALIPLLIAAIGSYGVLSYAAQIATSSLHESVYSGIRATFFPNKAKAIAKIYSPINKK